MLELNLSGLMCPLPVLKTKKFLAVLNSGDQVMIKTTDPAALKDLADFCSKTNNLLIKQYLENDTGVSIIERR